MRETTEIRIDEYGDETHESWLLISASKVQSSGTWLFDSDVRHHHFVKVTITRCTRKRELKRDWLHRTQQLLEFSVSMAQWGAFVSSFGDGGGVPATLDWLTDVGVVPSAPPESRLMQSHAEVRGAANEAMAEIQAAYEALETAFDGSGKRAQREALRTLKYKIANAAPNMEFAAKSLTEHTENVVTKAKADIEAMVQMAEEAGVRLSEGGVPLLGTGNEES